MPGSLSLQSDEQRILRGHPHLWTIVRPALPLPLLLALPFVYSLLDLAAPALRLAALFPIFLYAVIALSGAYTLKWLVLDLLPWSQSLYLLTDRRLVVQEGLLSVRRRECGLDKVEECDYTSVGFTARLFDYGTLTVELRNSPGTVTIPAVASPRRLQAAIDDYARRRREEQGTPLRLDDPDAVARRLTAAMDGRTLVHNAPTVLLRPLGARAVRAQRRLALLPDEAVLWTARPHPVTVLPRLGPPLFLAVLIVGLTLYYGTVVVPLAVAIIVVGLAPWAAWQTIVYLNHEYILTTERLMELRATPFTYRMREIVSLDGVQDVTLEIPGLLGRLASVGDVVVESGNGDSVILQTVREPAALQQLIVETLDGRQRNRRAQDDARLVETLSQWFTQYHKLQQGGNPPPDGPPS